MKIKNIVTVLLVAFILASCTPAAKVVPTEMVVSTLTFIPVPIATATITPTLAPENLVDAEDLSKWVDDFVHAYGGKVTVNNAEMDASQLTDEIRKNADVFTQVKKINGVEYLFLVINDAPLAVSTSKEQWRKILGRDLSGALNMEFSMPALYSDISDPQNSEILQNASEIVMTNDLAMNVVYGILTTEDWKIILNKWDSIKSQINKGQIPTEIRYNWGQADAVFKFAKDNNMKVRVQNILDSGDAIPDAIYTAGFSKEDLMKILEFTASVTALKYKGLVEEWSIEGEQVVADINKVGNEKYGFWMREVGLVDATEIVARTLRKVDPGAKLIITEDHLLDKKFANEQPTLRIHFFAFIDELQKREVPLDGVGIENNAWIYNPPDMEFMKQILDELKTRGLYIANSETTVLTTDEYPWYEPVQKTGDVAPEIIHGDIAEAYILAGAKGIGIGNVGDKWSFWNYSGIDAKDSLFDSDGKPKPAFYEVLKVLYEHLP